MTNAENLKGAIARVAIERRRACAVACVRKKRRSKDGTVPMAGPRRMLAGRGEQSNDRNWGRRGVSAGPGLNPEAANGRKWGRFPASYPTLHHPPG